MAEFFHMGGYGGYVWPAYAAAFAVLGAVAVITIRRNAHVRAELSALEQRAAQRKGTAS